FPMLMNTPGTRKILTGILIRWARKNPILGAFTIFMETSGTLAIRGDEKASPWTQTSYDKAPALLIKHFCSAAATAMPFGEAPSPGTIVTSHFPILASG